MKQEYSLIFGKDLNILNGSMTIEIFVHAIMYDQNIAASSTSITNIGEKGYDGNRWFWDSLYESLTNNNTMYSK